MDRVIAGERISDADALALYHIPLADLGALADHRRNLAKAAAYGGRGKEIVTYIIDRTSTTRTSATFTVSSARSTAREETSTITSSRREQLDQKLDELTAIGGIQILLQGGHHPKLGIDWYLDMLSTSGRNIRTSTCTDSRRRSSTTSPKSSRCHCARVITRFPAAGLGSIPGGGGEILVDRVRKRIAPLKCDSDHWLEVMQIAHELGMRPRPR